MIPALLAAPMVQGIVGGVVGSVMNCFRSSEPTAPTPVTSTSFSSALDRASSATPVATTSASSGIMRSSDWNQMSDTDVTSWAKSLTGRHVEATDASGKTISGIVGGVQQAGNSLALNIGGHLVSLSQLNQISWSTSAI